MAIATLDGHCVECNLPIMIGQQIRKQNKPDGKWVHEACADDPLAFKNRVKRTPKRLEDQW